MEKISKIKSWLFKKINKFAKPRARLIKEKKKTQSKKWKRRNYNQYYREYSVMFIREYVQKICSNVHKRMLWIVIWASLVAQLVNCTCNARDLDSIPGLGRSPGEGKGYPLQYSGLENSMDCIVHGVTKSWTQLNNFHFHFQQIEYSRRNLSIPINVLSCKNWIRNK